MCSAWRYVQCDCQDPIKYSIPITCIMRMWAGKYFDFFFFDNNIDLLFLIDIAHDRPSWRNALLLRSLIVQRDSERWASS